MEKPENYDEASKEEILANIKLGMQQALRGDGRPAHEVLDEMDAADTPILNEEDGE